MKYDIYHHEFDGNDAQAVILSDMIGATLDADKRVSVSMGFEHQNPVIILALPHDEGEKGTTTVVVDNIHIEFEFAETYDDEAGQPHGDIVDEPAPEAPATTESEQPSEQQPAPEGEW